MQVGDTQVRTYTRPAGQHAPSRVAAQWSASARLLDAQVLESLLLNIDASLRVYSRPQLFGWTQGLLQNLLRHDLLLCALREERSRTYRLECFASPWIDSDRVRVLFQQDVELVAGLVGSWIEGELHPVVAPATGPEALARGELAAELQALGADSLLVHGTYDALGKPVSLFIIGSPAGELNDERAFLLELIAPFLHQAWMRSQLTRPLGDVQPAARAPDLLTAREMEILRWIHLGKSNSEIGTILGISPLTVKNHVQKILRKLKVRNRAQAVGRALALRFLDP